MLLEIRIRIIRGRHRIPNGVRMWIHSWLLVTQTAFSAPIRERPFPSVHAHHDQLFWGTYVIDTDG